MKLKFVIEVEADSDHEPYVQKNTLYILSKMSYSVGAMYGGNPKITVNGVDAETAYKRAKEEFK